MNKWNDTFLWWQFEVERRDSETRIGICCGGKPGLLLSTVTTLEALGIDIQHCVISCFNDFAMQASCSEVIIRHQLDAISSEILRGIFNLIIFIIKKIVLYIHLN